MAAFRGGVFVQYPESLSCVLEVRVRVWGHTPLHICPTPHLTRLRRSAPSAPLTSPLTSLSLSLSRVISGGQHCSPPPHPCGPQEEETLTRPATKLACTIGPSTRSVETLSQLLLAGMSVSALPLHLLPVTVPRAGVPASLPDGPVPPPSCMHTQIARFDFTNKSLVRGGAWR